MKKKRSMMGDSQLQSTIARIRRMEAYLDDVLEAMKNDKVLPQYETDGDEVDGADEAVAIERKALPEEILEKIRTLADYYENGQWLQDYDCDARGELPEGLKRGVLAQDTLYDLFCEIYGS